MHKIVSRPVVSRGHMRTGSLGVHGLGVCSSGVACSHPVRIFLSVFFFFFNSRSSLWILDLSLLLVLCAELSIISQFVACLSTFVKIQFDNFNVVGSISLFFYAVKVFRCLA